MMVMVTVVEKRNRERLRYMGAFVFYIIIV